MNKAGETRGVIQSIAAGLLLGCAAVASAADTLVVGLMGDSTVAEYRPDQNIRGWGQYIGESLEHASIVNKAVGGLSTKTCLLEGRLEMLLARKPEYVLIQFGHNDSHAKDQPGATDAATDYKDNLRKLVGMCREAGAMPVLVTPVHRRDFKRDGKMTQELKPYADAMKEVAREEKVFLVDLYSSSGVLFEKLGDAGAEDLFGANDRSHFSEKGARAMARLVTEGLATENGALVKHLKREKEKGDRRHPIIPEKRGCRPFLQRGGMLFMKKPARLISSCPDGRQTSPAQAFF